MKRVYEKPIMCVESFVAEQYVAASACGTHITSTPPHGHVQLKNGEIHCAFTSSNCGSNATSCAAGQTSQGCSSITGTHQIITQESGNKITAPVRGHNCHILSSHEAAVNFAKTYTDKICGAGVAALMGLSDFNDIVTAWS